MDFIKNIKKQINYSFTIKNKPPTAVAIETNSICNRSCEYCPVSIEKREKGEMSRELFIKIIDGLDDLKFNGLLTFHHFNEPLIDKRLPSLIEYARSVLIEAHIRIVSNGDLINEDSILDLFHSGISELRISGHDEKASIRIEKLISNYNGDYKDKIFFQRFYDGSMEMSNWGGTIKLSEKYDKLMSHPSGGCKYGQQLTINYRGESVICCRDYFSEGKIGDHKKNTVKEIWNNSSKVRKNISLGNYEFDICKNCNVPQSS